MSSGNSTESEPLQPWQLFTLAGLVGATIVVFMSRGQSPAAIVLLSLTIFTAAGVGVAAWRTFGPLVLPEGSEPSTQILGGRTRAALEREKALALRSLKELEFDRAMGKVSDKDYAEMSARLRARAARLLSQLDAATGYRELIEREVERRLARGGGRDVEPASASRRPAVRTPAADAVEDRGATVPCGGCGTANDADARFCKGCGTSLRSA